MLNGADAAADRPILWRATGMLTHAQLLDAAAGVAARLPAHRHLVNLCESREAFLIAFVASMIARQVQLMPATRTAAALAELEARYSDSHRVTDADIRRWRGEGGKPTAAFGAPSGDQPVLTAFTSGSTGQSQAHEKHWRALQWSHALNAAAIRAAAGLAPGAPASIVGTVPSHHMYGIELTVLLPLFADMSVHVERPLFPADIAAALEQVPAPRVLVSTPLHLRSLAESAVPLPPIALVVCATAPLDAALSSLVESRLGAPVLEMFGSTETCVIATRQTAREPEWTPYEGVKIEPAAERTRIGAPWLASDQMLNDVVELREGGRFVLCGRQTDTVEVAGKRASLADITRRLCAVPGVEDAVAFQPESAAGAANRVAALVVSRGLTEREIARELAKAIDAVFLPRPLLIVDRIPRDSVGKISRARLLELARSRSPGLQRPAEAT